MTVGIITVSDRASRGEYEDLSGAEIEKILREDFPQAEVKRSVVPDDEAKLMEALKAFGEADFILTTGGTGIGPRDITPDVSERFCERSLPGFAEILRAESYKETNTAVLSRGYAGMKGNCIVVNFPGSVKAVRLCTRLVGFVMEHAMSMLRGEGH